MSINGEKGPGEQYPVQTIGDLQLTTPTFLSHQKALLAEKDTEIARLKNLINSPETENWMKGVPLEAAHQAERWTEDDPEKTALDWFWLIGYLAQKAAYSHIAGDAEKAKHHTISTAAALLNWHRSIQARGNQEGGSR